MITVRAWWPRIALVAIPVVFLVVALLRAAPFTDDVNLLGQGGNDDWHFYKTHAVSMLAGDLSIPDVKEPYRRPAGFLYNYFLAGIFALLGVNATYVYVLQSVLLALSTLLLWAAFRPYLGQRAAVAFLVACVAFAAADFLPAYTFRLLSEDLFVFLMALALLCIVRAVERQSLAWTIGAGIALGLSTLTRPNFVAAALLLPLLWLLRPARSSPRRLGLPLIALAFFLATLALLPLRNLAAVGAPEVTSVLGSVQPYVEANPRREARPEVSLAVRDNSAGTYAQRLAFVAGYLPALDTSFRPRVHWILAWLALVAGLGLSVARRRVPPFWQLSILAVIVAYLAPLIYLGALTSYGFRFIAPIMPLVVLLALAMLQGTLQSVPDWGRRLRTNSEQPATVAS